MPYNDATHKPAKTRIDVIYLSYPAFYKLQNSHVYGKTTNIVIA